MEMRQDDVLDLKAVLGGELEIALNVALGIDNDGGGGGFVADEVGGMGQAV
jgi:hypothetical protein